MLTASQASKFARLAVLLLLALVFHVTSACGGSATWSVNPPTDEWNSAGNWTPATIPSTQYDTATFSTSNVTGLTLTAHYFALGSVIFEPGGSAFTISLNPPTDTLDIYELEIFTGVVNNSGMEQNFVTPATASGSFSEIVFSGQANAGLMVTYTNVTNPKIGASYSSSTVFEDDASAGMATLVNQPGNETGGPGGQTAFNDSATADKATIICQGGKTEQEPGGVCWFMGSSHAGGATLIAEDGSDQVAGGEIFFESYATGDKARLEVFGSGFMQIAEVVDFTIGSLEGDGHVYVGGKTFNVGSNNRSTVFSGEISDSGSFAKIGTGTLTLNGTVTLATTIAEGTMGGRGKATARMVVGTGRGIAATLAPAAGTNHSATFTVKKKLTFQSDGIYRCLLTSQGTKATSDRVVATGVTIDSGAQFVVGNQVQGTLAPGASFTVISNIASTAISGTFANLADGATLTVGNTKLQASYEGGDGNDLTLTVVP